MATLLDEYRRHAADHGAHMARGDADASNASYDRLQNAFLSLARKGNRDQLFVLYDDVDPFVQCWAAAHTLEIDEPRALQKLEQLEQAKIPHVSFDAKYTIQEWKSGELKFLPP
jgi:hypothetical protein